MPKWTDYTIKTTVADNDEIMTLDTAGKANKRLSLSTLSDWVLGKIADKVFEKLQTNDKTILGAINELNSKALFGDSISIKKNTSIRYNQSMKLVVVERAENVTIDKNIESGPWVEIARVEEKYFPQHTTTFPIVLFPEGIAYGMITEKGVIKIYTNRKLISGKDQLYFQFLYFTA